MPRSTDRHDEALRVLRKVRDLLSDRSKWVAGALARTEDGQDVQPHSSRAVKFCAAGAINKVAHQEFSHHFSGDVELAAVRILERALSGRGFASRRQEIPHVNDGPNGYERIMEGLAKAVGADPQRSAAAKKGWATRRHNQWLREMEATSVDPRPELMTFGGTIVASPVAERKEVTARVS
jgi:hypothetical protein